MKKQLWKFLIVIGLIPLILPFVLGVYHTWIESWTLGDWLILYSFTYWPTYVLGVAFATAGVVIKKRQERKENGTL